MIGIIQGRLTYSGGKLQCFPNEKWKDEFELAKNIGFDYLELITDPEPNPHNPLWSGEVNSLIKVSKETGTGIYSLTVDHIMHMPLTSTDESTALKSKEALFSILRSAAESGVKIVVLPFLEGGSLKSSRGTFRRGVECLKEIDILAQDLGIQIAIESDLDVDDQMVLVNAGRNIGTCYDTGNRTYMGYIPKEEVPLLGSSIKHVHIKDKLADGKNVMLGTGKVDFESAISALKKIGYKGGYTLETSRGTEEISAAQQNLSFLKELV